MDGDARPRPSAQNHVLVEHVVDGLAVDDGPRATRIVGHHAADRGSAGGRQVRCESQSQRSKLGVEIVEDDARLTRAQRSWALTSRTRFRYFEVSSTRPAPMA